MAEPFHFSLKSTAQGGLPEETVQQDRVTARHPIWRVFDWQRRLDEDKALIRLLAPVTLLASDTRSRRQRFNRIGRTLGGQFETASHLYRTVLKKLLFPRKSPHQDTKKPVNL